MDPKFNNPSSLAAEFEVAQGLHRDGQLDAAIESLEKILDNDPGFADAIHQLGLIFREKGDAVKAELLIKSAINFNSNDARYHCNLGNILQDQHRLQEAAGFYNTALKLKPDLPEVHLNLGLLQQKQDKHRSAIESFSRAIALRGDWSLAYLNRGNSYGSLRRFNQAVLDYDCAIKINPFEALAYVNRGIVLYQQNNFEQGRESFKKGLQLNPNNPDAIQSFATSLARAGDAVAAANIYAWGYQLYPRINSFLGSLIHQKLKMADWSSLNELMLEHSRRLLNDESVVDPFGFMGFANSEHEVMVGTKRYSAERFTQSQRLPRFCKPHAKIKVGYLGGEFCSHATSFLLTGVIESFDKNRFELYAFDSGRDDQSAIRKRMEKAFDHFTCITEISDGEAADLINKCEIDILIDLNGFFGNARQEVLAYKPSPIQVSYLGCPGTMGADYVDYLVADATVLPPASEPFYSEKIVRLPGSYQCNDDKREISQAVVARDKFGLPEQAFVFCCFNNVYKILPDTFDRWVRILLQVKGSVLWLFESHPVAVENLRKEAAARGLDPSRLIFAKHLSLPEHLARHRLADLFIDTLPYNAHTTASDALWAGLPLLTLVGKTFPERVGASLLKAIDMPELITTTPEEYEAKAIDLATHPEKLAALKAKLAKNRLTTPLFNTKLYTKHFEAALTAMYQRYQAGLPPDHIEIKE